MCAFFVLDRSAIAIAIAIGAGAAGAASADILFAVHLSYIGLDLRHKLGAIRRAVSPRIRNVPAFIQGLTNSHRFVRRQM